MREKLNMHQLNKNGKYVRIINRGSVLNQCWYIALSIKIVSISFINLTPYMLNNFAV